MSSIQIGGLASGLDTKSIIDQLMQLSSRPILNYEMQKTELQVAANAFEEIGKRVASLRSLASSLKLASNINKKNAATSQSPTSTGSLAVTASASAANQTFKVAIKQLATQTSVESGAAIGTSVNATADLTGTTEGAAGTGLSEEVTEGSFTVGIDGTLSTFTITAGDTLNDVIADLDATFGAGFATLVANKLVFDINIPGGAEFNIGTAGDTSNFLNVVGLADANRDPGAAATVTGGAVTGGNMTGVTLVLNGVLIAIPDGDAGSAADNADKVVAQINQYTSSTGVVASRTGNAVTLTHEEGGSGNDIAISYANGDTGLTAATTSGTDLDTIRSARSLGITQTSATLADSRLSTAVPADGTFSINGVSFDYDIDVDTINDLISRINSSAAKVTASYDGVEDKLVLRATGTGAQSISLSDDSGNFLAATGLLGATQDLGLNAIYSIDTLAGGANQTSASNTIKPLSGVTIDLKQADANNAITVTISQDVASTVSMVDSFVQQFNAVAGYIEAAVKFDPAGKETGLLVGDSAVNNILTNLRSMVIGPGDGLTGTYTSLGQIGLSFEAVGAASLKLNLNKAKLTDALKSDPNAVVDVFTKRQTSATLDATAGNVASIGGSPNLIKKAGTYTLAVDTAASPNLTLTFVPDDGSVTTTTTFSVLAGQARTDIIPGMTITFAGALTTGSDEIAVTVTTKGVAQKLDDYLNSLLGKSGVFTARKDRVKGEIEDIDQRILRLNDQLKKEEQALVLKFSNLEAAMARLQGQQASLGYLMSGLYMGSNQR